MSPIPKKNPRSENHLEKLHVDAQSKRGPCDQSKTISPELQYYPQIFNAQGGGSIELGEPNEARTMKWNKWVCPFVFVPSRRWQPHWPGRSFPKPVSKRLRNRSRQRNVKVHEPKKPLPKRQRQRQRVKPKPKSVYGPWGCLGMLLNTIYILWSNN